MARRPMDRDDVDLPPVEAARDRRRDRAADAPARAGMRTGLAKQFKQVLDAQVKRAGEDERTTGGDPDRTDRGSAPQPTPPRKP